MPTDRELLEDCLLAFEAMETASKARKLLKRWSVTPGAYAGSGQFLLANHMIKRLQISLHTDEDRWLNSTAPGA